MSKESDNANGAFSSFVRDVSSVGIGGTLRENVTLEALRIDLQHTEEEATRRLGADRTAVIDAVNARMQQIIEERIVLKE
jgi:hypothetical protein